MTAQRLHGTAVAIGEPRARRGVLITGRSGSGKSDLALRLIDRGAVLVADDQVIVEVAKEPGPGQGQGPLLMHAVSGFEGRLEVRGLGIVRFASAGSAPLALWAELGTAAAERLPEGETRQLLGASIPLLRLDPRPAAAPILLELALNGRAEPLT